MCPGLKGLRVGEPGVPTKLFKQAFRDGKKKKGKKGKKGKKKK